MYMYVYCTVLRRPTMQPISMITYGKKGKYLIHLVYMYMYNGHNRSRTSMGGDLDAISDSRSFMIDSQSRMSFPNFSEGDLQ